MKSNSLISLAKCFIIIMQGRLGRWAVRYFLVHLQHLLFRIIQHIKKVLVKVFEMSDSEKILLCVVGFFILFGKPIIKSISDWRQIILLILVILWFIGGYFFTKDNKVTIESHGHVHESNGWTQYLLISIVIGMALAFCYKTFF